MKMIEFEIVATLVSGEVIEELVWATSEISARDAFLLTQPNDLQFSSIEVWKL
jgi:hypothetical protein